MVHPVRIRELREGDKKTFGNSHVNDVSFDLTYDMKDQCVVSRTAQGPGTQTNE